MINRPLTPPTLSGLRLHLRPFLIHDAAAVQALAGSYEVASGTLTIPHPYEDGMAEAWINTHARSFAEGRLVNFAVVEHSTQQLAGAIGLTMNQLHGRAELGYWIGVPYWNRGYATEAVRLVLQFGFEELRLHRIHAQHFTSNPASARVLQKVGMRHEGCLREHVQRWDAFEDAEQYGILSSEWQLLRSPGA